MSAGPIAGVPCAERGPVIVGYLQEPVRASLVRSQPCGAVSLRSKSRNVPHTNNAFLLMLSVTPLSDTALRTHLSLSSRSYPPHRSPCRNLCQKPSEAAPIFCQLADCSFVTPSSGNVCAVSTGDRTTLAHLPPGFPRAPFAFSILASRRQGDLRSPGNDRQAQIDRFRRPRVASYGRASDNALPSSHALPPTHGVH
jgi:hypothetical protein